MSKNVALFVDVANLYYSARGQDVDVDYVALLKTATKGRDLIRAYAYSGLDPENENQRKFIDFLNKNGYKVLTKDIRKFGDGRVKANLDIELVVDLFRLADRMDIAVIVSGDGDFAPAIKALQDKGIRCEVISFRPNTSSDLIAVADEFIDIMKIAGIGRGSKEAKAQRGMSAPEMPAKEVVPEFGFREASPGVAAAALAALREGRSETAGRSNGSGRGRGRGRATAAPPSDSTASSEAPSAAPETEAAVAAEDAALGDGEARRRRRRRGGRGRGRGGRGRAAAEGEAAGEPVESGEIGWVELDDISQLGELETVDDLSAEREYSFEEADADTLAELGLSPDEAGALGAQALAGGDEIPAEPTEEKKPARRRRTTRKSGADAGVDAAEGPDAEETSTEPTEQKKPARRRTPRKPAASASEADAPAATAAETDAAGDKPKRSRTRAASGSRSTTTGRTSRTSRTGRPAEGPGDAEPAAGSRPSRRRTATKKESAGEATPGELGEDTEGIWQRFRSARKTGRSS